MLIKYRIRKLSGYKRIVLLLFVMPQFVWLTPLLTFGSLPRVCLATKEFYSEVHPKNWVQILGGQFIVESAVYIGRS